MGFRGVSLDPIKKPAIVISPDGQNMFFLKEAARFLKIAGAIGQVAGTNYLVDSKLFQMTECLTQLVVLSVDISNDSYSSNHRFSVGEENEHLAVNLS